ncbi:uncharacterized protein LOC143710852 [Siphateles boraxobius]|uniref:uncharacterized protein LOC143710852 n=1 Tax=Siphateles boraxobius TaxID=180520 RepID=UPI0040640E7D
MDVSERTPASSPRASLSPNRSSPVLFEGDQRPPHVAGLVSFGGPSEHDDSLSIAASEEEWPGSFDPAMASQPTPNASATRTNSDAEMLRILTQTVADLELEWAAPAEPPRSRLDGWFLPGHQQAPRHKPAPFFPEVHEELTKAWRTPYSTRGPAVFATLSSVDGAAEKGYESLPPLEEALAAHLCPNTAASWRTRAVHPNKPCRSTSALAGRAYSASGQAASALHTMAVLQVYQAKLLRSMDEAGPDPEAFRDLRSATDLALRATKATAQAIGRNMASLVVLERHLWLTLTDIKDAERTKFLDAPVSSTGLFGPAVKGFSERYTEAQKASQAMRHFLPKRSSSASSAHKLAPPTLRPTKPTKQASQPRPAADAQRQPRATKRFPLPRRQGPRPSAAPHTAPPKSS